MAKSVIRRVGVVVKPHQPDALKTVCSLVKWLHDHSITLVGTPDLEKERVEHETGCVVETVAGEELAGHVDLIIVLGGDGTMIATARMLGDSEVPVLGINYGSLGYLAEFRMEEMFPALETILDGQYQIDSRVMLAAELFRADEQLMRSRVLNDVVINKSALARIIEIETS
ncbi:MAG TPA: NAD(+)/NADH kinase, partial [Pyrinomonadaceae bacterium]